MYSLPVIPQNKKYWLVRTQGGKYYNEFKSGGFIGINWNEISFEDIDNLSEDNVKLELKRSYPNIQRVGTTYNQLRIFANVMKPGDTVVITGTNSNKFSVGQVTGSDKGYIVDIDESSLENYPNLCPYTKRRRVKWFKEFHKWDVEMEMFKLLQHAQHTISDANEYEDVIESMIHDFYIRGDYAQISLEVTRDGDIPPRAFFEMGNELLKLAEEFGNESISSNIDIDNISTSININSPGKIKFKGSYKTIFIIGILFVGLAGGGINVKLPKVIGGGSFDIEMNSVVSEISRFLNDRQDRSQKQLLLQQYIHDLEMESPNELAKLINALESTDEVDEDNPLE